MIDDVNQLSDCFNND
jgi:hypothetical protein